MLRLSFRKGGDKALYGVLKRSLLGKAWQVGRHLREINDKIAETLVLKQKRLVRELPHRATNGLA